MIVISALLAIIEIVFAVIEAVFRTIAGALAVLRVWMHRNYDYRQWLKRDLADCETILEIGCGSNSPILQIGLGKKTDTFDVWMPYIEKHNKKSDYRNCWQQDVFDYNIPLNKYDAIVMCDVLEHLDSDKVIYSGLFGKFDQIAKKKIILFTPNGFIENNLVDDDPYQAHLSAWEPRDYQERGYTVKGATGLRWLLGVGSLPKYHPYSIVSIIAMLSQRIIYNHPTWAWHSYAVKEIK